MTRSPWLPLIVIVLAQLQMAINVTVLPVSLGPIAHDLDAPATATATATALLLYWLFVAAFVMLGAKIGKLAGERLVFQIGVVVHGASMVLMATSTSASAMNVAQVIAGITAAAIVPTLVVLIAAAEVVASGDRPRPLRQIVLLLVALVVVVIGAELLVDGSVRSARSLGVSDAIIGLTIVAIGTSAPSSSPRSFRRRAASATSQSGISSGRASTTSARYSD